MTWWQLLAASLSYHVRMHVAVALGVAAATAVLVGGLLVGDSMTGSLRSLTLDRLGRIDQILIREGFFRADLAKEVGEDAAVREQFAEFEPVIMLPRATIEHKPTTDTTRRAAGVFLLGIGEKFWSLGRDPADAKWPVPRPRKKEKETEAEIVLNEPLAKELGVQVGDHLTLRLPKLADIPEDSALGRKENLITSLTDLEVVGIVPATGLGRFDLSPSQREPHNAWIALETLQDALDQPGKINAVLIAGKSADAAAEPAGDAALLAAFRPTLGDLGFRLDRVRLAWTDPATKREETIYDYFHFTSEKMILSPEADKIAESIFTSYEGQPCFTYMANSIFAADAAGKKVGTVEIPYSTIAAIDSQPALGPVLDAEGKLIALGEREIALNSWAAERLGVKVGDAVGITYFQPESIHGRTVEKTEVFTLKAIAPLTKPSEGFRGEGPPTFDARPTVANDWHFTPEVKGLTDKASIDDWDPPFPYDSKRIRPQDEDYWSDFRTTPKAYLGLTAGRGLWESRFGQTTSYRIPAKGDLTAEKLGDRFMAQVRQDKATLDYRFLPIKRQGLAAASGTTPFSVLFLAFSMFLIAAAVMLTALLFRLGVERRAEELGVLAAVGWQRGSVTGLLAAEGAIVAAAGGLVGVAGGVGYAWLMLAGLKSWWLDAIVTPFLDLYVTPTSLVIGYAAGLIVTVATIYYTLWDLRSVPVRRLLARQTSDPLDAAAGGRIALTCSIVLGVLGLGLLAWAFTGAGAAQAGIFFGAGASLLAAALLFLWDRFTSGGGLTLVVSLMSLGMSNAVRNPGRSTLTVGLVAMAVFLIVAVSSFHLAPTDAGTGGFNLLAESDRPIFQDLNERKTRIDRGISGDEAKLLEASRIFSLRVEPGDDASCLNLFKANRPRAIGISQELIRWFDDPSVPHFDWAASEAKSDEERKNPWHLLERDAGKRRATSAVPVVMDQATAMYSLEKYGGAGEEFELAEDDGRKIRFRVVGLLSNSVLQGNLLLSEDDLEALYPEVSGYRYFLARTPSGKGDEVMSLLEDRFGDEGFDAVHARDRLAQLLAVQNTYLSTFQSLGLLGLLLGTFGLATVQLRSVLERRGELALLRAEGFRPSRLAMLFTWENALLLGCGLGIGILTALLAVLPQLIQGAADVPWVMLGSMLAVVLVVGLVSGLVAIWSAVHEPILSALRAE